MKNTILITISALFTLFIASCVKEIKPVAPVEPLPNVYQLAWQELEYYGFIHFNMNTFTNKEWGYGDEKPSQFNPTELDARQWARVAKEAGMKGLIITAKHHDGFALWPSAFTEHSVKNSPWKEGKGDLIREISDACKEYGLKFGIYLSPWDRNHPEYGKPEYVDYYRNQLRELLTNYGSIFEVWFDGANGGDGYYGGANEERRVEKRTYYDWPKTINLVRELQPQAVIFSDAGPDIRWIGNERGYAYDTTWSPIFRDSVYAGMPGFDKYAKGQENGTHWVPTESDVSIRPGWYYHPEQDDKVKTVAHLVDIYFNSVGKNSNFLLNLPVDTRGLVHENDVAQLTKLADYLKVMYETDFADSATLKATASREGYPPKLIHDNNKDTYWASPEEMNTAQIEVEWSSPQTVNTFMIQEYIPLGQRIKSFTFEVKTEQGWQLLETGGTIGNKRLIRFDTQTVSALRFSITDAKASPIISNLGVYKAPDLAPE
ncbi:MAG: alpha-L-fucosidase [Flavobacteriaceae bacterium]|nr:alpha-L-fucosidase [Flavobacteriaceae bacterium]